MKTTNRFMITIALLGTIAGATIAAQPTLPEPGPESGGLRLRLTVVAAPGPGTNAFNVRLDLINVANHPIHLTAHWENEETNDFAGYLQAAFSVQTDPPIEPWLGQVAMGHRTAPQPKKTLQPGETLTVKWKTANGRLNNTAVTDPIVVQNPRFPVDGQYSIHGLVTLLTDDGDHLLRSNDQVVAVGGSVALPKFTYGSLDYCEPINGFAILRLGRGQGVEVGDKFIVQTGYIGQTWTLTVTNVNTDYSTGTLIHNEAHGPGFP
ncbi:MAG TPA: hypothetical protein VFY06_05125, partial [Verrucomicrobiae bacterium]|nr:hypothetical protein [Verrucomicrobiae bacterium]